MSSITPVLKFLFFAFFAHDSGKRPKEAPLNMLLAMGVTAALCFGIGVYPQPLYDLLPYPVDYVPYTTTHVITMLQLLMFSALAFAVLQKTGLYPPELRSTVLDTDWFYRVFGYRIAKNTIHSLSLAGIAIRNVMLVFMKYFTKEIQYHSGPESIIARATSAGTMVVWVIILLVLFLIVQLI